MSEKSIISENRQAFNLGCDARIRGDSPTVPVYMDKFSAKYYEGGYWHADRFWGKDAKGRSFVALPKIAITVKK